MCTICAIAQTFDPARHEGGQPILAAFTEGADAADSLATIYGIGVGDTFTGTLSSTTDEDWVAVTLEEGARYDFNLEGNPTNAGTLSDPYLRLYDRSGTLITQNDDGGTGVNSLISFTATSSGTFYLEVDAYMSPFGVTSTGTYRLSVTQAGDPVVVDPGGSGDPASLDTLALQLTDVFWGNQQYTWNISSSNEITVNLSGLTADGQQLARWAMEAWEMSANLTFREVSSGEMITVDDENTGAYAYSPGGSGSDGVELNVSRNWLVSQGTTIDSYSFQTFVHEFGHAIGLGHMGAYDGNATYGVNNSYTNDSWQTSVMSYFSQTDNTDINASYGLTAGPMMADVLAIQNLYGMPASSSPTAGNTTYGANTTLTNYLGEVFNVLATGNTTADVTGNDMVFNLYDLDGFDRIDLNFATTNDRIDLNGETFSDIGGMIGNLSISRGTVIEALISGSGDDTVTGNAANNVLETRDGNDSVNAGAGNDRVYGGSGFDTIQAGDGNDSIWGGDGRDLITLGNGNDSFFDTAQGGVSGRDTVFGGAGNDTVEGGNGDDEFHGGDGNDVINARLGADTVYGGNGFDTISAGDGNDEVYGGNGRDLVFLNQGDDLYLDNSQGGELGQDTVYTGLGNDTVQGGNGNDVFHGEDGNDVIFGRLGDDAIFGGNNYDTIDAGDGNDLVYGGNGRDAIVLGNGNDRYVDTAQLGVNGQDTITGGAGVDTFVFGVGAGGDVITDFASEDRLELASGLVGGRTAADVVRELARVVSNFSDSDGTSFGSGTLLEFGTDQTVFLQGLTDRDALVDDIFII